ncbi:unnamed protein product, partial [Closterium sp. NIES-54]
MYAVTDSAEGDCYLCVPPDPVIEAAALGASESAARGARESALSGTAPTEALHTFTLDSGASRSFFRDSTTLTPLTRPVVVSLADPSMVVVLAHSSTVLPCRAAPSGLLSGLHLPSFSTNLVSGADLQDAWVDQFTSGGQRVTHCTCSRTGRHLATFTRRPGSSLYTLTTASPPVTASGQVAASGQVFSAASRSSPASASCSCRPLSHETLLWHHRLGHSSLPRPARRFLRATAATATAAAATAATPAAATTATAATATAATATDATTAAPLCCSCLYLLSDSKDHVSLFDLASGAATAPPATGQHRTAQALYDAVVARYSSPASTALGQILLPYLFPELIQPPIFITLYFILTRLPDSLRSVRDHFLSLDPTSLTVDLLEQHLLADETSAVAVGAARGTPRTPFFQGCSPSPLAPSYASAALADVPVAEDVGAASASVKCRSSKGKGGWGGGGGSGRGGGGSNGGGGGSGGGGGGGGFGGGGGGSGGSGGGRTGAPCGGFGGGHWQQQQRRRETQPPQQLREWLFQRGTSGGSDSCPYVIRTDLLRSGVAIFDLDFDVILSAIYALSASAEGDCYQCVPPDATALGASESILPGTAPAEALHTFTLDSGALRCFFRDSTTLTPLSAPVAIRLDDPSGGPVNACSSTVLPCPTVSYGSQSGLHLPSFSTNL